jgi:hypothetical protein
VDFILFPADRKNSYNNSKFDLSDFNLNKITHFFNEKQLIEKTHLTPEILYDKILYLIDFIDKNYKNENINHSIKYFLEIINKISNYVLGVDEKTKSQKKMEYLILLKTINILYNYYSHKKISNQTFFE